MTEALDLEELVDPDSRPASGRGQELYAIDVPSGRVQRLMSGFCDGLSIFEEWIAAMNI